MQTQFAASGSHVAYNVNILLRGSHKMRTLAAFQLPTVPLAVACVPRLLYLTLICTCCSSYFVTGYSGNVSYVRPIFERLAPTPGNLVERILYQASVVMSMAPVNHFGPVPCSMIDPKFIGASL